jgi:hypothetical protein
MEDVLAHHCLSLMNTKVAVISLQHQQLLEGHQKVDMQLLGTVLG